MSGWQTTNVMGFCKPWHTEQLFKLDMVCFRWFEPLWSAFMYLLVPTLGHCDIFTWGMLGSCTMHLLLMQTHNVAPTKRQQVLVILKGLFCVCWSSSTVLTDCQMLWKLPDNTVAPLVMPSLTPFGACSYGPALAHQINHMSLVWV